MQLDSVEISYEPHTDPQKGLCNQNNWFTGYNWEAKFHYEAFDVHPTENYYVVGGAIGFSEMKNK